MSLVFIGLKMLFFKKMLEKRGPFLNLGDLKMSKQNGKFLSKLT